MQTYSLSMISYLSGVSRQSAYCSIQASPIGEGINGASQAKHSISSSSRLHSVQSLMYSEQV